MTRRSLVGLFATVLVGLAGCGDGSEVTMPNIDTFTGADVDAVVFPDGTVDSSTSEDVPLIDSETPPDTVETDTVETDTVETDTSVTDTSVTDTSVTDTSAARTVDWCRLQWPLDVTIGAATTLDLYGRVNVDGLTTITTGNDTDDLLKARAGYGPADSDPSTWTEWFDAIPNIAWDGAAAGEPDNDEYTVTLPAFGAVGSYDFAFSFSLDGGSTWVNCDRDAGSGADGSEDGYQIANAGKLIVVADPCATNPCTTPPDECDGGTLRLYQNPGVCTDDAGLANCTYVVDSESDCTADGAVCNPTTLACEVDPCTPNPCTTQPEDECQGNELVSFAATGTCDDSTGAVECAYDEASRSDCAGTADPFCAKGACHSWRLAGVGDLAITEVMPSPDAVSDSKGEWFEVLNISDDAVNLWGLVVFDDDTDSFTVDLDVIVDAGDYAVFGINGNETINGGVAVDYDYDGMFLSAVDELRLSRDDADIDGVAWDNNWTVESGASLSLAPGEEANNDQLANWCAATVAYGDGDLGTPGAANPPCSWTIGWCKLAWPLDKNATIGVPFDVYGQVYVPGLTDQSTGPDTSPLLVAEVGWGDENTTAATWNEWFSAGANAAFDSSATPNNDEYFGALIPPAVASPPDYAFAMRFSGDGGQTWTYCDRDGGDFSVDMAGKMTVTSDPCAIEPCTTPPDACDGDTLRLFASPGTCALVGGVATCTYTETTTTDCVADNNQTCDPNTLACIADPCAGVTCDVGLPAVCEGNEVVTYAAAGSCDHSSGSADCVYPEESRTDCGAQFCQDGACVDWRFVEAGDLKITEIQANPAGSDATGEWFEVLNTADVKVNLRGLTIIDNGSKPLDIDSDLFADAGAYLVFGINDDPAVNGGVVVDMVFPFDGLSNGGDRVVIKRGDTVLERVNYDDHGEGALDLRVSSGKALQLAPGGDSQSAADWCQAYTPYGDRDNNYGTPGAPNDLCSVSVDWCRLQWPETADIATGGSFDVWGHWFSAGLTDVNQTGNDESPLVWASFGISNDNNTSADPASWTWTIANLNANYTTASPSFEANNDEWMATLSAPSSPGFFYYAFRVSGDRGATWTYCDLAKGAGADGSEDGFNITDAGELNVSDPCAAEPCTTPTSACDGDTLKTFASPGTCSVVAGAATCAYTPNADFDCASLNQRCDPSVGACVDCLADSDCAVPFEVCDTNATKTCVSGCVDDAFEPSDSTNPHILAQDITQPDLVICDGDSDWYDVNLTEGDTLEALINFTHADGDLALSLRSEATGTELILADSKDDDESLTYTVPVGGDGIYQLVVSGVMGAHNTYELTVIFDNDPCAPNPCTAPPADLCIDDHLFEYPALGACSSAGGVASCDYDTVVVETVCPNFCNDGACTDWRYAESEGDLVITEIMPNPAAGAQYIELFNPTADSIKLKDVELDTLSSALVVADELIVAPGSYAVLGWGFGDVDVSSVTLLPDADMVALTAPDGATLIDEVDYDDSAWPLSAGVALSLNPELLFDAGVASSNDDASNWCGATTVMGDGDKGTPGLVNDACLATVAIDYCRLQFPTQIDTNTSVATTVYGRVYIPGVTDQNITGNDPNGAVVAEVGYGPVGSDPAVDNNWTWTLGGLNPSYVAPATAPEQNNDEYMAALTAPDTAGLYDFAFRFSGDGGQTWMVCDDDGVTADGSLTYDPAHAGELNVTAPAAGGLPYISEYVEGGGVSKALEIFNPAPVAFDLAAHGCEVRTYSSGDHDVNPTVLALTGVIAPGDVFVACHSGADAAVLAVCDQPSSSKIVWNGNDPVEFFCDGASLDWVGQTGAEVYFAKDVTLQRKCTVTVGDPIGDDAFDRNVEWDVLPKNTFDGLGTRGCP